MKNLIIFVTPTIIDSAGDRMNSDADAANQIENVLRSFTGRLKGLFGGIND